ncbi:MAG: adenosylcobinamide amidohydrolase [Clostridia bacterium]|nr:adenosylcobinamide amidohydrolase [Clostridia bacterium]
MSHLNYRQLEGNTIFTFPGKTKVLSTSPLNGGITTNLKYALNINCMNGAYECEMLGDTYEEDLKAHVRSLDIDPVFATALSTAAWTELNAVKEKSYLDLTVTAMVTAGIDSNGMCAGDPSSYYEHEGKYEMIIPGTINIFLYINQNLTDSAMLRALVIASEAKANAVSQLLLGSNYSEEIATGSGTDGTVIASNLEGSHTLTDASGHSKLGELVGCTVKEAVKEALMNQTAACGARQFQVQIRTARYGITPGSLWDFYFCHINFFKDYGIAFSCAAALEHKFSCINRTSNVVLCVSLYLHLMDQIRWGLIMEAEAKREGKRLLLNGLFVKKDTFLENTYPKQAWNNPLLQSLDMKQQLEYLLLFFMG